MTGAAALTGQAGPEREAALDEVITGAVCVQNQLNNVRKDLLKTAKAANTNVDQLLHVGQVRANLAKGGTDFHNSGVSRGTWMKHSVDISNQIPDPNPGPGAYNVRRL